MDLHRKGIEVYMLTGDAEKTASYIASQAGIRHFRAGLMPDEKAAFIAELQAGAKRGDGGRRDQRLPGFGFGQRGDRNGQRHGYSDGRGDGHHDDLRPDAPSQGRQPVPTHRPADPPESVLGVHIQRDRNTHRRRVLYPVYGILLNPMWAGAAMALSSVSVVANSLRLGRGRSDLSNFTTNLLIQQEPK